MKPADMKVLLTGATGGIGSCIAERLADRGAELLLVARNRQRLRSLCHHLRDRGARVDFVAADLATPAGRARIAEAARQWPAGINVLVNNAGINRFGRFADASSDDIAATVETNLLAPMLLTQALLPALCERRGATLVNIGSILGSIGLPGQVAYTASKFALHGFSEALRRELRGSSVRVVYVAPRSTDTEMNEADLRHLNERAGVRTDDAASVAEHIVAAMTDERAERFIGWPERLFVKLNALLPSLVDRSLIKQTEFVNRAEPSGDTLAVTHGVKT